MAQVQCPNCGGYKVETKTETIDRESGQTFDFGCGFWFLLFFTIALLCVGTMALQTLLSGSPGPYVPSDIYFPLLGLPIGLFLTVAIIRYIRSYFKASKIEKYYHTCLLCGYKWSRKADEPLPPVTLRPDLIAKGEQRLQEEQQARDAAAAAWWIQQQQKKK